MTAIRGFAMLVAVALAGCDDAPDPQTAAAVGDTEAAAQEAVRDVDAAMREARAPVPSASMPAPVPAASEQTTDRAG